MGSNPTRVACEGFFTDTRKARSIQCYTHIGVGQNEISFDFRNFYKSQHFLEKKTSSHQGKEEVACIVSKPLVSCLWGCGESVNPQKINIQEEDPGSLPIFQDIFLL